MIRNLLFSDWPKQHFLNSTSECVHLVCSEHTSRAVSTPRVRYIRTCVYFCLLSIRCFNVVQPETRFHFQSANQIAKKGQFFFLKFKIFKKFHKNVINFINFKIYKISKFSSYFNILIFK